MNCSAARSPARRRDGFRTEICGSTLGFALMHEQLLYSPQAQLDLDEICDYFSNELNDPDKGHGLVGDISCDLFADISAIA